MLDMLTFPVYTKEDKPNTLYKPFLTILLLCCFFFSFGKKTDTIIQILILLKVCHTKLSVAKLLLDNSVEGKGFNEGQSVPDVSFPE